MNEQLLLALKNFAAAANVLNSYWTHANEIDGLHLASNYPFADDFETVVLKIDNWLTTVTNKEETNND
jgi:hypothetical protein